MRSLHGRDLLMAATAAELSSAFWFWGTNDALVLDGGVLRLGAAPRKAASRPSAVRLATWNLLAPPYARGPERAEWRRRLELQQQALDAEKADVIALQEFWNDAACVASWNSWARDRDYSLFVLPRTRGKADGCATLVKAELAWSGAHEAIGLGYDDWGDRVCLVVPVGVADDAPAPTWVCNTHWTFAHDNGWDPEMRKHQARKLATFAANELSDASTSHGVVVAGDLNGGPDDPAVLSLVEAGFALNEPLGDWVSHRAHTGAMLACDFVSTKGRLAVASCAVRGTRDSLQLIAERELVSSVGTVARASDAKIDDRASDAKIDDREFRVSDHLMLVADIQIL